MAKTAVGELHARLVADIRPYETAMQRAAAVTQQAAGKIEGRMSQLQREVARKFTASDIGKDLLRGLGIGSGFQAAEMISARVIDYYRDQAEFAKAIEESTARTLESTRRMIALRQSPEEQLATAEREFARTGRELEAAKSPRQQLVDSYVLGGNFGVNIGRQLVTEPFTEEQRLRIQQLTEQYQLSGEAVSKLKLASENAAAAALARQEGLRLQEIMLGAPERSAAQVRGEIGDDDAAPGRAVLRQMGEARTRAIESMMMGLVAENGRPRVDEMTRRGLGTGANYSRAERETNAALQRIEEILKRIERKPAGLDF